MCGSIGQCPDTSRMPGTSNSTLVLLVALLGAGCDSRSDVASPTIQARKNIEVGPSNLGDRLLNNLSARQSWEARLVKCDKNRPSVHTTLTLSSGKSVEVQAWGANSNDYYVPMMRLDGGDLLYELAPEEWRLLASQ